MKLYPRTSYEHVKKTQFPDKWKSNCPFCNEKELEEYTLWKGNYWRITHNKYPFVGSSKHLLAIPLECISKTANLSVEAWAEFRKVEKFMEKFFQNTSYYSFIRERGKKKSIHHLHYHFLPWEIPSEPFEKLLKEQWFEELL